LVAALPGFAGPALVLCEAPPPLALPVVASVKAATVANGARAVSPPRRRASSVAALALEVVLPAAAVASALRVGKAATVIVFERPRARTAAAANAGLEATAAVAVAVSPPPDAALPTGGFESPFKYVLYIDTSPTLSFLKVSRCGISFHLFFAVHVLLHARSFNEALSVFRPEDLGGGGQSPGATGKGGSGGNDDCRNDDGAALIRESLALAQPVAASGAFSGGQGRSEKKDAKSEEESDEFEEEEEDEDREYVSMRIAIKPSGGGGGGQGAASSEGAAGVFNVQVLPRLPLPANEVRRASSLTLLPLPAAHFLSTAEMRQRSEAAAALASASIGKADGSAASFRRAAVALRTEAGCAWRRVPRAAAVTTTSSRRASNTISSNCDLLVSVATGQRSLWRSTCLTAELEACSAAATEAAQRLATLPPRAYEVTRVASKGNQPLPRVLVVTSDCVQRLSLQAYSAAAPRFSEEGVDAGEYHACGGRCSEDDEDEDGDEEGGVEGEEGSDVAGWPKGIAAGCAAAQVIAQAAVIRINSTIRLSNVLRVWTEDTTHQFSAPARADALSSSWRGGHGSSLNGTISVGSLGSSTSSTSSNNNSSPGSSVHGREGMRLDSSPEQYGGISGMQVAMDCVVAPAASSRASSPLRAFSWAKQRATARATFADTFDDSSANGDSSGNSGAHGSPRSGGSDGLGGGKTNDSRGRRSRLLSAGGRALQKRTFYYLSPSANEVRCRFFCSACGYLRMLFAYVVFFSLLIFFIMSMLIVLVLLRVIHGYCANRDGGRRVCVCVRHPSSTRTLTYGSTCSSSSRPSETPAASPPAPPESPTWEKQ
jgi:hypothetical protein